MIFQHCIQNNVMAYCTAFHTPEMGPNRLLWDAISRFHSIFKVIIETYWANVKSEIRLLNYRTNSLAFSYQFQEMLQKVIAGLYILLFLMFTLIAMCSLHIVVHHSPWNMYFLWSHLGWIDWSAILVLHQTPFTQHPSMTIQWQFTCPNDTQNAPNDVPLKNDWMSLHPIQVPRYAPQQTWRLPQNDFMQIRPLSTFRN